MADLDELLADLDDDVAAQIRDQFKAKEEAAAKANAESNRVLKLKTDADLRSKYPRAIRAYEADDLTLPDDLSDEALVAALAAKEKKLEAMGVPAGEEPPKAEAEEPVEDPAKALSGQSKVQSPTDLQPESAEPGMRKLMEEGGSTRDFVRQMHALHREGRVGEGAMRDIIADYEADPHPDSVIARI